ncbi:MAG: hypothetical protein COA38_18955 [Fluviicola sp.]|nr:MAG: hypothetical protein COA38_18955 [Fluviicola sp.]
MKKTNTTLDREPMNSEAIRQRQNFNYILKETAAAKIPIWKSIWFYGPVGIAMVTMVVSAVRMNPKNETYDNNTTLSQIQAIPATQVSTDHATIESFESTIAEVPTAESEEIPTVVVEKQIESTVSTDKVDDNTKLKPEVLAEENIEIEPVKSAPVVIPVVEKKIARTMPNIAGVFSGRISVLQICSAGMIHCNNGYQVISYDIQYDNGAGSTVDRVSGSRIPSYICANLKRYNVGSPVFITKIIAMNEKGERKQLLSMSLEPTF